MQSCWIFMTDAAMEKCKLRPFLIDLIIAPGHLKASFPPKRWSTQYAEPIERIAF